MKKTTILMALFFLICIQSAVPDTGTPPFSVTIGSGGSENSSGNPGINPITLINNRVDSPDFSYMEAQANERLRELKDEYNNRIADLNRLISSSSMPTNSTPASLPPEAYTASNATSRALDTWIKNNASATARKLDSSLANNETVAVLSNEIASWSNYSYPKKTTINLAKEYIKLFDKFEENKDLINSKIEPYLIGVMQTGLDELTAAARIAGNKSAGDFEDEIELAKSMLEISNGLLDIGLGLIPVVSVGKDAYEAYTGKSLLNGHELDLSSRAGAVLGIVTLGGSNVLKTSFKGIVKLGRLLYERKLLGKEFEAAVNLADYTCKIFRKPGTGEIDKAATQKFTEILNLPKGSRPPPETYLPTEYIKSHLAKFENGASKIMRKSQYNKYGVAQADGTSFVLPKSEADNLIASAGGNTRLLEENLGFKSGFLDKEELIRVDISNSQNYNIRIPSGNEAGASDLWIPGGKLPNGNSEAVIDANKISADNINILKLDFK
ncbi:MAG: hypothetical protein HQK50_08130 [Oligoflexia bacterium]|nr:hypothetical protein [Oligoflexia bacterium]